jgi:cobalt/nickel transport protein
MKRRVIMKRKMVFMSVVVGMIFTFSFPAWGHFQTIYTPQSALSKSQKINIKLIFTHPWEAGHTMDIGKDETGKIHPPIAFGVMHKGKKKDLLKELKAITFTSLSNSGRAYETDIKLRGMGDHIFYFMPPPYYESAEDVYIQQCTKAVINIAGAPTDWDTPAGDPLPAEIIPLDKPYSIWKGMAFRGIVTRHGKPVPNCEIEVTYMNHNIRGNAFVKEENMKIPQPQLVPLGIKTDKNGEFSFTLPKAGWWGFCALGAGGDLKYKGKELSQDAVIWVQVVDM